MKKLIRFCVLFNLLFIFADCSNHEKRKSHINKFPKTIQLNLATIETDTIDLSFIGAKIEYLPLQTSGSVILEYFDNYIITDDRIFIQSRSEVLVFDSKGNFINSLFTPGRGPEEALMRCFAVDESNRWVYVYDRTNKVKVYDYNGSYIDEINNFLPTGYRTFSFGCFNDALFVHTSQRPGTEYLYSLFNLKTDSVHILCRNYREYNTSQQGKMPLSPYDYHYQLNDTMILFKERFSDTIYKVTKDLKKKPQYIIELGNKKLEWEYWRDNGMFLAYNPVGPPKGYQVQSFIETQNFLFLVLSSFSEPQLFAIYNKKTDLVRIIRDKNVELPLKQIYLRNNLDNLVPFSPMNQNGYLTYSDNCLFSVIEAGEFANVYSKASVKTKNATKYLKGMISILDEIDEFDNPIIIKLFIK